VAACARQPSATRLEPTSAAVPSAAKQQKDNYMMRSVVVSICDSFSGAFDQQEVVTVVAPKKIYYPPAPGIKHLICVLPS
jgi:hypothetical protein